MDAYAYKQEPALVLFSGGQDSTTCLFWALQNFKKISTISFFYNQKHAGELEAAQKICRALSVDHKIVDISFMKDLVISNLFAGEGSVNTGHALKQDVPASFVPYRNLLFLTLAAAWASTTGVNHLVIGACETDSSGYADCRDSFMKSLQESLNLATDFEKKLTIHTPLMWLTKAEEFKLAADLGCLDFILNETVTCYNADNTRRAYGRGCDTCPACMLRKKGFYEYKEKYESK